MAVKVPGIQSMPQTGLDSSAREVREDRNVAGLVGTLGGAAIQEAINIEKNTLRRDLETNEQEFRGEITTEIANLQDVTDEVAARALDVDPSILTNAHPQVRTFLDMQAKHELAQRQGILSPAELEIRQEKTLREFIARNPNLTSEFLSVARHAGGFGVVSQDIQQQLSAVQAGTTARQEELERVRKAAEELGVNPQLYTTDPLLYWAKATEALGEEETLAATERMVDLQNANGTLTSANARAAVRGNMGGILGRAERDYLLPVLAQLNIAGDVSLAEAMQAGAINLEELNLALLNGSARFRADIQSRLDPHGLVPNDEWDQILEPATQMFEFVSNQADLPNLSQKLEAFKEVQKNEFILSMPGGAQQAYVVDILFKLQQGGILQAMPEAQEYGRFVTQAVAGAVGSRISGQPSQQDANGDIDVSGTPQTTLRDQALSIIGDPAQAQAAVRDVYKGVHRSLIETPDNEVGRQTAASIVNRFASDYIDQVNRMNLIPDDATVDAALNLAAAQQFADGYDVQPQHVKASISTNVLQAATHSFDTIMTEDVPRVISNTLDNTAAERTPAGERFVPLMGRGMAEQVGAQLSQANINSNRLMSEFIMMKGDNSDGRVTFELNIEALNNSDLDLAERERVQITANQLNSEFSDRLSNWVRAVAHTDPAGRRAYGAAFTFLRGGVAQIAPEITTQTN